MRYHFMAAYDEIIKALNDEDLPCGPVAYDGQDKPKPRIIAPIVAAPLASFSTLPQAWIWPDWIRTGKLGRNLVPSGNFNDPERPQDRRLGRRELPDRRHRARDQARRGRARQGRARQGGDEPGPGRPSPARALTLDSLVPFVDHPVVAVRSPAVKVGARQVYRISVMAYMANPAAPGAGGLIVRDSIGGERLQFRTPSALATDWFEIVYYRRVPADGTMSVTLGMAGYGYAAFDDLKVEPIVETGRPRPAQAGRPAPAPPGPPRPADRPAAEPTSDRPSRPPAPGPRPPTGPGRSPIRE